MQGGLPRGGMLPPSPEMFPDMFHMMALHMQGIGNFQTLLSQKAIQHQGSLVKHRKDNGTLGTQNLHPVPAIMGAKIPMARAGDAPGMHPGGRNGIGGRIKPL